MIEPERQEASVLDPAQLVRIEAVHRGFLFQHLYTVQCLLSAAALSVRSVEVESDEDVEVQFEGRRIYVQVKHRKKPLAWNDIEEAVERFAELRAAHQRGERSGEASRLSHHGALAVCGGPCLLCAIFRGRGRDGAARAL